MAKALRDWLPQVLHAIGSDDPFFSEEDIDPGTFSDDRMRARFADAEYCIVCVTPENVMNPWINYEAGAIAERLNGKTTPWALGVNPRSMKAAPLIRLQVMQADESGTRRIIQGINKYSPRPVSDAVLSKSFDRFWPELEEQLQAIPVAESIHTKASVEELAYESVTIVRQLDRRLSRFEALVPPEVLKEADLLIWRKEYQRMMADIKGRLGMPAAATFHPKKPRKTGPRKKPRKTTRARGRS